MTAQQFFARAMRTVRILWGALTFSNVLLGVVTVLAPSHARQAPDSWMVGEMGAMGLAVAVASFVLPARMYAAAVATARVPTTGPEPGAAGPRVARFAHELEAARKATAIAFTPFIVSMALSEAVSLLGVSLHVIGSPFVVTTPFIAAGLALSAVRFPTLARLVGPFERLHGASFGV